MYNWLWGQCCRAGRCETARVIEKPAVKAGDGRATATEPSGEPALVCLFPHGLFSLSKYVPDIEFTRTNTTGPGRSDTRIRTPTHVDEGACMVRYAMWMFGRHPSQHSRHNSIARSDSRGRQAFFPFPS